MSSLFAPRRIARLIVLIGALALATTSVAGALDSEQASQRSFSLATAAAPIPASQGGGFYIAEAGGNKVHRVSSTGEITLKAGTGESPQTAAEADFAGPATSAKLSFPTDAVPTADGGVLIAMGTAGGFPRVRKVDAAGNISTVAGGQAANICPGKLDSVGNGCPATQAVVGSPTAAVPTADGGFLIAEWGNYSVRKVSSPGTGSIITLAAGGRANLQGICAQKTNDIGDGCPATQAFVSGPSAAIPFNIPGAAVAGPGGNGFLITEEQGCRVRLVNDLGVISTVAGLTGSGSGNCRTSSDPLPPDSGTATALKLSGPWDARPTADAGVFLLADGFACAVRRVNINTNTYTTPVKDTSCSSSGGIGLTAAIPSSADGSFLVAAASDSRVKSAAPDGTVTVVAGATGNTSPPEITGTPAVGQTLTCSNGTWSNGPYTFTRKWNRDGVAITGATATTYVVTADDQGKTLTCTVFASKGSGQATTTNTATSAGIIVPAAGTPTGPTGPTGTTPPPGGGTTPPAGGGTTPPVVRPPAAKPKPVCTFTKRSGVVPLSTARRKRGSKVVPQPKNTIAVSVRCNQAARVTVRGSLKQAIKRGRRTTNRTVALTARVLTVKAGVATATTLRVPASAITALKAKAKTSAALNLTAVNANGAGTGKTSIAKLSTKK